MRIDENNHWNFANRNQWTVLVLLFVCFMTYLNKIQKSQNENCIETREKKKFYETHRKSLLCKLEIANAIVEVLCYLSMVIHTRCWECQWNFTPQMKPCLKIWLRKQKSRKIKSIRLDMLCNIPYWLCCSKSFEGRILPKFFERLKWTRKKQKTEKQMSTDRLPPQHIVQRSVDKVKLKINVIWCLSIELLKAFDLRSMRCLVGWSSCCRNRKNHFMI